MTKTKNIPQGYKDSPLGIIPKDWEVKKLGETAIKIGDGIHGTPKYVTTSDYYFINGNNLINGNIVITPDTKCVPKREYELHKKDLDGNTILLSINGTIGNIAIFCGEKVMLGKSAAYIKFNDNLSYFYQLLQSNEVQNHFISELSGSTIRNLSLKSIRETPVLLPPLPEQKKIAEILSVWDEAIEKQTQLITQLETRKRGLMQQLLTGKKRLNGFSGKWKEVKLGDICEIKKGVSLTSNDISEGEYPVIAGGKVSPYNHSQFTSENVITISASGAYAGFVSCHKYKIWASDCSVITEKKDLSNLDFLFQLLSYKQDFIYSLQSGGAQPHIFPKDISGIKYKAPFLEEQTAIANILSAADNEINIAKKKLASIKEQKKGLMQVLLTGKKRVKTNNN